MGERFVEVCCFYFPGVNMKNPMMTWALLVHRMNNKFPRIILLVTTIPLKVFWSENLTLRPTESSWRASLQSLIRGGEVHQATSFPLTLLFPLVKEIGMVFHDIAWTPGPALYILWLMVVIFYVAVRGTTYIASTNYSKLMAW